MEDNKNIPQHEKLKYELMEKFAGTSTYLGSFVKQTIQQTSFKNINPIHRPLQIKKGDVFLTGDNTTKVRPAVILKVLKDNVCVYTTLTSTINTHCLTPYKSRFFGEGCFAKTLNVASEDYVMEHFIGVFDNMKAVNQAIKDLKTFFNNSL